MAIVYNTREIFEIGVQIEKNGRAFYAAAAEKSDDQDTKQFLLSLSEWESEHVAIFTDLLRQIDSESTIEQEKDLDDQFHQYLKAAADSHIFVRVEDSTTLLAKSASPLDILTHALQFEKDSVVLYTAMKELVPQSMGKEKVNALIYEEMRHVALIGDQIAQLSGDE
jgi:rubrerythrin